MRQRTVLALAKLADSCFAYTTYSGNGMRPLHLERTDWLSDLLFERDLPNALVMLARSLPSSAGVIRQFVQDAWLTYGSAWVMNDDPSEQGRDRAFEVLAGAFVEYSHRPRSDTLVHVDKRLRDAAEAALLLDGLARIDGRLQRTDESAFDVVEVASFLESAYARSSLPEPARVKKELRDIDDHYESGKWGDSIKHARDLLEMILKNVARDVCPAGDVSGDSRPPHVRTALSRASFWSEQECKFVNALYQLLSEEGGHPNLAEQENALICRQYALSVVHFVLLRHATVVSVKA